MDCTNSTCGNGICEPSADEYDLCPSDCTQTLPPYSQQYGDVKSCLGEDDEALLRVNGVEIPVPFTVAHFGPRVPPEGITTTVALAAPEEACDSSVEFEGVNNETAGEDGIAVFARITGCHFIDKTKHIEDKGVLSR